MRYRQTDRLDRPQTDRQIRQAAGRQTDQINHRQTDQTDTDRQTNRQLQISTN